MVIPQVLCYHYGMKDHTKLGVPSDNVRALSRGIAVLQAINNGGSVRMMDIAREADIPYPTACRIVATLTEEGLIEREPARKRYRPTALVQTLSHGFQNESGLVAAARPHIVGLCKEVGWPISIATRVGSRMMVRDSTHNLTSLTLTNYAPGFTLPLAGCSTGKVYLAFCTEEERLDLLFGMDQVDSGVNRLAKLMTYDDALINQIRSDGYAMEARNHYTSNPGKTSSIAVPIFDGDKLVGAMALIIFAAAMKLHEARDKFLPQLQATAEKVGKALSKEA
jgi:IclR family mhp operon transcriptional activator